MVTWVGEKPGVFVNESTLVPIDEDNLNSVVNTLDKICTGGEASGLDTSTIRGIEPGALSVVSDEKLTTLFSFDQDSGLDSSTISDDSGSGNYGTAFGTFTKVAGVSGRALQFGGTQYIKSTYTDSTSFTLSCWFKGTTSSGLFRIINLFRTSSDSRLNLSINNGAIEFRFKNSAGTLQTISGPAINDNTFHFLAAVHNGITGALYVDGTLISTLSSSLNSSYFNELRIGASEEEIPTSILTGIVDEIRVYTKALTLNEIISLFYNKFGTKTQAISENNSASTLVKRKADGSIEVDSVDLKSDFNIKLDNANIAQTADTTLSIKTGNANRILDLGANLAIADKSISAGSVTITIPETGTVATLAGAETLTNKTLTQPKLNEDVAVTATATEVNKLVGIGAETVATQLTAKADINSPEFTGTPTVPDTTLDQNDGQAINTKSVVAQIANELVPINDFKTWNIATTYNLNDPVFYNGVPYRSLTNSNTGNNPASEVTFWEITGGGQQVGGEALGVHFENGQFETSIAGWNLYRNTTNPSATSPDTGTGGTAVGLTLAHNTTNPLFGDGDLLITKDAVSSLGSGFSYDFTVDSGFLSRIEAIDEPNIVPIQLSFTRKDTFATPLFTPYLIDIASGSKQSGAKLINNDMVIETASAVKETYVFFANNFSTNIRLCFHCSDASASNGTEYIDNVCIGLIDEALLPTLNEKYAMLYSDNPSYLNKFITQSALATELLPSISTWSSTRQYVANDHVRFLGDIYKAVSTSINTNPKYSSSWIPLTGQTVGGFGCVNNNTESSTYGFELYNDGVVEWPIDGSGGAASVVSIGSEISAKTLNGGSSLRIVKTTNNARGQGVSYSFTVERGSIGQQTTINFSYQTETYIEDSMLVAVYDTVAGIMHYSTNCLIKDSFGNPSRHTISFVPASAGVHRLIFHVKSTSSTAWNLYIDNIDIELKTAIATYDAKLAVEVNENYTVEARVEKVVVTSSEQTITIPSDFELFRPVTIMKTGSTATTAVTINPPSGATFEGKASISLYGQYSFVEIERISATVFAVRDFRDLPVYTHATVGIAQVIPAGGTNVLFESVISDKYNALSNTQGYSRYVVPFDGIYVISACVDFIGATDFTTICIYKNGIALSGESANITNTYTTISVTTTKPLLYGDILTFLTTPATQQNTNPDGTYSRLEVVKID